MNIIEFVRQALLEDLPEGDKTTDSLELDKLGRARLFAKEDLVLSGTRLFEETFIQVDKQTFIQWHAKDGDPVSNGSVICSIQGDVASLLKAERTAINFLSHLSGIATLTAKFVDKTKGTKAKISDTRKTLPLYRELEKEAVRHGGGINHRNSLSFGIMVKENHIRAAGGIKEAVDKIRKKNPGQPIQVEVTNKREIQEALDFKVEKILLDNMNLEELREACELVGGRVLLEASGNMTLDRIESVAKLGLDFISVGRITHSAPSADVSLLFTEKI